MTQKQFINKAIKSLTDLGFEDANCVENGIEQEFSDVEAWTNTITHSLHANGDGRYCVRLTLDHETKLFYGCTWFLPDNEAECEKKCSEHGTFSKAIKFIENSMKGFIE